MVQPVQSAHVVAPPGSNHAALSVHHHTDDSSTAHVVVPAGIPKDEGSFGRTKFDIKRQTNGVSLTSGG